MTRTIELIPCPNAIDRELVRIHETLRTPNLHSSIRIGFLENAKSLTQKLVELRKIEVQDQPKMEIDGKALS